MSKLGANKSSQLILGFGIWCFLLLISVACVKIKSDSVIKNTIPSKIDLISTSGPAQANHNNNNNNFNNLKSKFTSKFFSFFSLLLIFTKYITSYDAFNQWFCGYNISYIHRIVKYKYTIVRIVVFFYFLFCCILISVAYTSTTDFTYSCLMFASHKNFYVIQSKTC